MLFDEEKVQLINIERYQKCVEEKLSLNSGLTDEELELIDTNNRYLSYIINKEEYDEHIVRSHKNICKLANEKLDFNRNKIISNDVNSSTNNNLDDSTISGNCDTDKIIVTDRKTKHKQILSNFSKRTIDDRVIQNNKSLINKNNQLDEAPIYSDSSSAERIQSLLQEQKDISIQELEQERRTQAELLNELADITTVLKESTVKINKSVLTQNQQLIVMEKYAGENMTELADQKKKIDERTRTMQSSIWTSLAIITWILLLFIGTYFIIRVFPKARNNTCSPMTKAYGINNFSNNNNQDVNPTISALLKSDDETDSTLSNTIIDTVDEVASGGINSADSEGINDNSMHIEKLTHDLLSESDVERVDMNGLVEIGEGQDNEQEILIGIDGIEQ